MKTDPLKQAIETLYRVFARYEVPSQIDAADEGEAQALQRQLTAVPLRDLDAKALGDYSASAMSTIDGSEMYRHFLPRILEFGLERSIDLGSEPFIIAHKLEYGEWRTWPQDEQDAVTRFFYMAWEYRLEDEHVDPDWLLGIARAGLDVDRVLETWQQNRSRGALLKSAHMIGDDIGRIRGEVILEGPYWDEIAIDLRRRITAWLLMPERRARFVAALTKAPGSDDHWTLEKGIATWDRLTTVP